MAIEYPEHDSIALRADSPVVKFVSRDPVAVYWTNPADGSDLLVAFSLETNRADPSGAAAYLDACQRTYLVSLAHSDPPPGWTKWTLSRLAEELVASGIVATISPEEVMCTLLTEILRAGIKSKSSGSNRDAGIDTQIE